MRIEVIDLFAAAGLDEARLDILSDEFLERVAALEQKNLALETLQEAVDRPDPCYRAQSNLVQSKKFREALEEAMLRYTNKAITTAEMIARLLDLAQTPARCPPTGPGNRPERRGNGVL
jgi:type I restriction enzyme R subunit